MVGRDLQGPLEGLDRSPRGRVVVGRELAGPDREQAVLAVEATATVKARTGVEMEAMTAVSVACLTVYDMLKAVDREIVISEVRLEEKRGGKSGTWSRARG